jgi:hypothetical protein
MPSLETAARSLKVASIIAPVHSDAEIEPAIIALGREPGGGLVVVPDIFTNVHRAPIILAAARNNVPAVYHLSTFARDMPETRADLGQALSRMIVANSLLARDASQSRGSEGPGAA